MIPYRFCNSESLISSPQQISNQLSICRKCSYLLREKCPNTEFFLVRIFPPSDWIRRDTEYLSVFSLNAGKYGPAKSPHLGTFHPFIFSTEVQSETSQKSDKTFWENSFDFQPLTIFAKRSIFDVWLGS